MLANAHSTTKKTLLRNNLWIRVELQKSPSKLGSSNVVVGFAKTLIALRRLSVYAADEVGSA